MALRVVGWLMVLMLVALATLGGLRARSQRQVGRSLALHTPDSVVQSGYVLAGGVSQWVQIRGEHRSNPVLLILHGGPGMSYVPLTPLFREWERDFTIVLWDRRSVGRTLRRTRGDTTRVTFDRLATDGIAIAEYLRTTLHATKIGLIGHSVGSVVGVRMARRRPDLFFAYVGTDQIADMQANESESYRLLRERGSALPEGDTRRREIERLPPPPYTSVDQWFAKQRLISATDPIAQGYENRLFRVVLTAPGYSLGDLRAFGAGLRLSAAELLDEMMTDDLLTLGTDFAIPMFLFEGDSDVLDPTALAVSYFDRIRAPRKETVLFKDSGHNTMFQRSTEFRAELRRHLLPLAADSTHTPQTME